MPLKFFHEIKYTANFIERDRIIFFLILKNPSIKELK